MMTEMRQTDYQCKEGPRMDSMQAKRIINKYYHNENPTEDDKFFYTEALGYLIETENDPHYMMELGGHYYGMRKFDLALRYYEMAADLDFEEAYSCLGYVWYYGRTGVKDYKRAFECFSKCMEKGDMVATYKIADMYKNGYYVQKDPAKYKSIIEGLYKRVQKKNDLNAPIPEIYTRLAKIRQDEERIDEAVDLYMQAKFFLAQRISYNDFFGNMNIMEWLVNDLYQLIDFDDTDFDLFDLYYLMKKPVKVAFWYEQKKYTVESFQEEESCTVKFGNKWYRSVSDFISKATIQGEKLTTINMILYGFEVV